MTPVRPYTPDTTWTFSTVSTGLERTVPLELQWEVNSSPYSDDFSPDELTAVDLWNRWLTYLDGADGWHDAQGRPWLRISWFVTAIGDGGVFEFAPHELAPAFGENFLTHFTPPRNDEYGEVNWLRVPVRDLEWNKTVADKGGFIQEATGWKPSALQPAVNLAQLAAAARLRAPTGS
jgi:hypothetical protein